MKLFVILFLLALFGLSSVSAAEVALSTPQSEYYVLTGEEATIPLSLGSTYNHDVTGTLELAMTPVHAGTAGSRGASMQTRTFSAFTEPRTVSLPVGKSDTPAEYQLTVTFRYQEGGMRMSTLGGIVIHFVASMEDVPANQELVAGTDTVDVAGAVSPGGSTASENPVTASAAAALQNSQMTQDTTALQNQIARESNQSVDAETELLGYINADPLVASLDDSLTRVGFTRQIPEVIPVSNRSGSFLLTYSSGTMTAVIKGTLRETRVMFAEESSTVPVPLPVALTDNTTYREYGSRIAETGFTLNQSRINVTVSEETVDLTYSGYGNRLLHMKAVLQNGTVISVVGDDPADPSATLVPVVGISSVLLISAAIWYLARIRPADRVAPNDTVREPDHPIHPREIAARLLDEAERDAARGIWPEAYRKTGRAIRIVLSHEIGDSDELTTGELERLINSPAVQQDDLRWVLNRCLTVGFAREIPDPGEFQDIITCTHRLLDSDFSGTTNTGSGR